MNFRSVFVSGVKWQILNIIGRQLVSFIVFAILARLLSREALGQAGICLSLTIVVGLLAELGLGQALIQSKSLAKPTIDTAFTLLTLAALSLSVLVFVLSDYIALALGDAALEVYVKGTGALLLLAAISGFPNALLSRAFRFKILAQRVIFANVFGGIFGVISAFCGAGAWSIFIQQGIAALVGGVYSWYSAGFIPKFVLHRNDLKPLLSFGLPVCGSSLLWVAFSRVDQFLITRHYGADEVALFLVAGKVPEMVRTLIHQPIGESALSSLARLQDDRAQLASFLRSGFRILFLVAVPCFVGLMLTAKETLLILFGDSWSSAVPYVYASALVAFSSTLQAFLPSVLSALSLTRLNLFVNLTYGILVTSIAGCLASVSPIAIAYSVAGASALAGLMHLLLIRRHLPVTIRGLFSLSKIPIVGALAMIVIVSLIDFLLPLSLWTGLIVKILSGSLTFVSVVYLLDSDLLRSASNMLRRSNG